MDGYEFDRPDRMDDTAPELRLRRNAIASAKREVRNGNLIAALRHVREAGRLGKVAEARLRHRSAE